ncbi:GC-rich sequence DNA-binding factor-like protein-domain-containing protein, partial [Thamnocephalis sphaerospora]
IARPIETKLRPGKMGIAYGGFKEKTHQAREDDAKGQAGRVEGDAAVPGWMKTSRGASEKGRGRKKKTVYRTIDEVIADAERESAQLNQKVVDYTGPQARTISSADIRSTPTGSAASTRLMELRHNLGLLTDMARTDVARCGREKRIIESQQSETSSEMERLEKLVTKEEHELTRLKAVNELVTDCRNRARIAAQSEAASMQQYEELLDKLVQQYPVEYRQLELDTLVVSLLAPIMRQQLADWDPLADPTLFLAQVKRWRPHLRTCSDAATGWGVNRAADTAADTQVGLTVWTTLAPVERSREPTMTAYDSMMYHIWLPHSAVALMEAWQPPLLPQFLFSSICDQVLIPKLRRALDDWNPRQDTAGVHTWLHPWLPIMSEHMEELWAPIRHKLSVVLQQWHPSDPSALYVLQPWHGVFRDVDMDALLASAIIPKLTMALRLELNVDPNDEHLAPIDWLAAWLPIIPTVTVAQLLEQEFFPKWLDYLRLWLQHEHSGDDIVKWYMYWKERVPKAVQDHPRIQDGFRKGLDLMNQMVA